MRFGKKVISCLLSFAMALTMMCGLFVFEVGAATTVSFTEPVQSVDYMNNIIKLSSICTYTGTRPTNVYLKYGTDVNNLTYQQTRITVESWNNFEVTFTLKGLTQNINWCYQLWADIDGTPQACTGRFGIFNASAEVSNVTVSSITDTSATISATFKYAVKPSTAVCILSNGNSNNKEQKVSFGNSNPFTTYFTFYGLDPNSTYNCSIYTLTDGARSSETYWGISMLRTDQIHISDSVSFSNVNTISASHNIARVTAKITYTNTAPTRVGVELSNSGDSYYTSINFTPKNQGSWISSKYATFTFDLKDLDAGTYYKYRYFAVLNGIKYYSTEVPFTTTVAPITSAPSYVNLRIGTSVIMQGYEDKDVLSLDDIIFILPSSDNATMYYFYASKDGVMIVNGADVIRGSYYGFDSSDFLRYGTGDYCVWAVGSNEHGSVESPSLHFTVVGYDISNVTVSAIPNQTYTGSSIFPPVYCRYNGELLEAGVDAMVAYENYVNVGTATVIITGLGRFTGTKTVTFKIVAKDIISSTISAIADQTYTGAAITPAITIKDGTKTLTRGTDYTVSYRNNTNVGTATVTITGKGNYTGTKTATFKIVAKSISSATISAIADQTYTGSALTPAVTVKDGTKTLTNGTDYTAEYTNNVNVGTATVTVTGKGNYTGTKTATFKIVAKSSTGFTVSAIADQTYTGSALTPAVTVKDGTKILTNGIDYTVAYSNNTNAGTATVTVTGNGNYSGTQTATFNILHKSISGASVSAIADQTYIGSALTPAVTVTDGTKELVSGTDYTVTYSDNTNVGTATVTVTGKGNYTGTKTATFKIVAKSSTGFTVSAIADQTYTGMPITPTITVTDGTKVLIDGTDYTVRYIYNTNSGTATVIVTGKGNYSGTQTATFNILPKSISGATVPAIADQQYTGTAITPEITVTDGTKELVSGTDYTVSYSNNTNAGTAIITITGKGNYTGTKTVTFTIVKAPDPIKTFTVADIPDQTYTGKAITPTLTVTVGTKTLVKGTDYIVTFADNIEVGTATAVVTGIGDYAGISKVVTFRIVEDPDPKPVITDKVVVNDGKKDTGFNDLLTAMKSISTGTGHYVITIEEDLTETKAITMPRNAASLSIEAPDTVTLTLKNASLTSKCDLTLENVILVTPKGANIGITAKKDLAITGSAVGALNVTGDLTAVDSTVIGKLTVKGTAELTDTTVSGKVTASSDLTMTDCPTAGAITVKGILTITGDGTNTGAISVTGKTGETLLENVTASGNVAAANGLTLVNCTVTGNITAKAALTVEGEVTATGNITTVELSSQDDDSVLSYKALSVTKNGFTGDNSITLRVIDKNGEPVEMIAGNKKAIAAKTFKGAFDAELVLISSDNCENASLSQERNKLMVV